MSEESPQNKDLVAEFRKIWRHVRILFRYWKLIAGLGVVSFVFGYWLHYSYSVEHATRIVETPPPPKSVDETFPHMIPPGSSLAEVLKGLGVSPKTVHAVVNAAKPVVDLHRLRAGTRFRLIHITDPTSELVGIEFQMSAVESVLVSQANGVWTAKSKTEKVESKLVTFRGVVQSNLWESAEHAKMDPELIVQLADVFAWQVDLAREVRLGDRWRLSVEQKLVKGKPVGWGSILAAEYQNGKRSFDAILFKLSESKSAYFSRDGNSSRRMFLKSPLRFGRITSRFSSHRFHPLLLVSRPHLGVDYGAPRGTPVRAIGDGVVTFAGWGGGGGRTLKIKHNNKYRTAYLHLNGFEKGIKTGVEVKQGQLVAYVGATGLATGPHLHFEFVVNEKVVDPLTVDAPPLMPVPPERMTEFKAHADAVLHGLPDWDHAMVAQEKK